MSDSGYYTGQGSALSGTTRENMHAYAMNQAINLISTGTLVKVVKFKRNQGSQQQQGQDDAGAVAPIGWLDIQPLVNLVDGEDKPTKHGIIHNVPYFRLASGDQHIIMDPQKDDIGYASFADRDISTVKRTLDQANPGSRRRFDPADAVFFGISLSNKKPKSYLRWDNKGKIDKSPDEGNTVSSIEKEKISHTAKKGTIVQQVDDGSISHKASNLLERVITGSGSIHDTGPTIRHTGNTDVTGTLDVTQLVTGLGFNTVCDRRAKSRFKRLGGVLERALALPVWAFNLYESTLHEGRVRRKRGSVRRSLGVVAQEVRELFPEIVTGEEGSALLSVGEGKIGVIALAALQEYVAQANTEIARLRQRIAALEQAAGPLGEGA